MIESNRKHRCKREKWCPLNWPLSISRTHYTLYGAYEMLSKLDFGYNLVHFSFLFVLFSFRNTFCKNIFDFYFFGTETIPKRRNFYFSLFMLWIFRNTIKLDILYFLDLSLTKKNNNNNFRRAYNNWPKQVRICKMN